MKKLYFLAFGLLPLMTAQAQTVTEYAVREAAAVREPFVCDSTDIKGNRYKADLLKTEVVVSPDAFASDIVTTDTTGLLTLAGREGENILYIVTTRLRAERFMKADLKITSPLPFDASVEGLGKATKSEAQDSISPQSTRTIALRMEPGKTYPVTLKVLVSSDGKGDFCIKCEVEAKKEFKDVACTTGMSQKGRFMLDNTVYNNRVTGVQLSPSGKYLITRYSYTYSADRSDSRAELTEVKTGKHLAYVNGNLRWMPKTDKLWYTRRAAVGSDLIIVDPVTQQEEILFRSLPDERFQWFPDEKKMIVMKNDEGARDNGPLKHILSPRDRIPGNRNSAYPCIYYPESGTTERLTFGKQSTYVADISPDGKKVLLQSSDEDVSRHPYYYTSTLSEFDLTTRTIDTIFTDKPYVGGVEYSPDGTKLLFTGGPEAFDGIGKNCGSLPIANDYDKQAFIMDLPTREVEAITRDFDPSIENIIWNRADGNIYLRVTEADEVHVYVYSPKARTMRLLPLETPVVSSFVLPAEDASVAAYYGTDDHSAGRAYLYLTKKGTSRLIADPMKEQLDQLELGQTEAWNFTASDGTLITGKCCLPPAFDASKKYPMIVYYYGGTTPTTKGISSPYCAQLLASRGYVVYVIQPSGTIGFGQEFSARHVNAWGKWTAGDIIEGVQKFCAAHPFVDAEHVGCMGASYGGFMTQYLQTQTDIFAAAVSHAGISNVTSYWGEGYWGYSYNAVAAAGSWPWQNPDLFAQGSLFNADKINTPLLLLHGTADTNVPIGESIQLFNALKILGKTVEFIEVEGENHFIQDYPKRILWHNTIMAWFARFLQGDDRWWNDIWPDNKDGK